jgi:UDP-N-acetylglucosamine--N-acetylmuramyl-(pentapeptide) pyrophosphoryl-undecaprenol N-acetylglucosamine transferase
MISNINKIIIATGGTGGHVFPAYSLAKHLIEKKNEVEIISDERGIKYLKNFRDIKITKIISTTLFRKNIFKFFFSILIILYSILKSLIYLFFNKPKLVFGMGGYSSFPVCIAAKMLRIPFIIYENNLQIGKANKYLLPFASKIFVSNLKLEGIEKKYDNKVCEIGNIIRKEILNFKIKKPKELKNKKLNILILGGSQAAKVFAERLPAIFEECKKAKILLKIYQQCLFSQKELLISKYKNLKIEFEIFNFSDNLLEYFSKADLAITRSGSSMLAELINVRMPFISIPLPSSADNHQLKNAIYYEKNQYSYLVEEKDLSKKLFKLIKLIYEDDLLLDQIINKQKKYSDNSVYENIDREMIKVINEKN